MRRAACVCSERFVWDGSLMNEVFLCLDNASIRLQDSPFQSRTLPLDAQFAVCLTYWILREDKFAQPKRIVCLGQTLPADLVVSRVVTSTRDRISICRIDVRGRVEENVNICVRVVCSEMDDMLKMNFESMFTCFSKPMAYPEGKLFFQYKFLIISRNQGRSQSWVRF